MAWEDRDYYRNREAGAEYFGNPQLWLSLSMPFGRWFGVPVRLHFWLLLSAVFAYMDVARGARAIDVTGMLVLLVVFLMLHEFSHRYFAHRVGGSHDRFVLWQSGGMYPPVSPPGAWAKFVTHFSGMGANLVFGLLALAAILALGDGDLLNWRMLNPLGWFLAAPPTVPHFFAIPALFALQLMVINLAIFATNLFPYYWFDGGYVLEAILQPGLGRYQAINVTCIVGMVIAVPMMLLSIFGQNLLGLILWALLLAGSFNKRRQLKAEGPAGLASEMDFTTAAYASDPAPQRRKPRWPSRSAVKAATAERREQETIDRILSKVHASGMNSLTWGEKRALKKATERQRRR